MVPELPEVETIARGLQQRIAGERVESVWIGPKPQPLKSPARAMIRALRGSRIEAVRRVGKHIVFDIEHAAEGGRATQAQWIVHLGMTGKLLLVEPAEPRARHTHAVLRLGSGRELRFVDPRRFGRLRVLRGAPFRAPGQEPLDLGFESFAALFHRPKAPIKSALLNQGLLRGMGNIYADESLFRAGIRPRRRAHSLTRAELRRLYDAIQQVLKEAIAAGGSSISDYVDSDGAEGMFQFEHRVYGREGEACVACRAPVKRVVISGRSAHYCPRCQR